VAVKPRPAANDRTLQEILFHRKDISDGGEVVAGQAVLCEFSSGGRHGVQARNIRARDKREFSQTDMTAEECEMHLARRQHEESVQSLFQTGFWKYPTSLETQPKEAGGNGLNFHPFVKDEKFSHCSSKTSDGSSAQHDLTQNGPDLSIKTSRKPWLKDGKIMPYLIKSPSRFPLQVRTRSRILLMLSSGSLTSSVAGVSLTPSGSNSLWLLLWAAATLQFLLHLPHYIVVRCAC
jgi:hypothetical protein